MLKQDRGGLSKPIKVLDLSCDTGMTAVRILQNIPNADVECVELMTKRGEGSEIGQIQSNLAAEALDPSRVYPRAVVDLCRLPYADGTFDAVIASFPLTSAVSSLVADGATLRARRRVKRELLKELERVAKLGSSSTLFWEEVDDGLQELEQDFAASAIVKAYSLKTRIYMRSKGTERH